MTAPCFPSWGPVALAAVADQARKVLLFLALEPTVEADVRIEACAALLAERKEAKPVDELLAVVEELGADERRVLLALARRLLAGQAHYGKLDLAHDGRDWRRERAEELADALVYGAIAEVAATGG